MFRKILLAFYFLIIICASPVSADQKVTLHLFYSNGCPHCDREKVFLEKLKQRYDHLEIIEYEVSNPKSVTLLNKVGQKLQVNVGSVPFTVVGEEYVSGYLNDETSGARIESLVTAALATFPPDTVEELKRPNPTLMPAVTSLPQSSPTALSNQVMITLPLFGTIEAARFSLPILTILIAFLDGFNPCAMWVLLFLISMLLGMKDRRRMWLLGTTFIAASALVYFLFLSAWLNLFLFLGFVAAVRVVVGIFALGVGSYQVSDYFKNKQGGCKVVDDRKRTVIFDKIKQIVSEKKLGLAMLGMVVLAGAVNLIELVCSAGLPAIYTHVLSLSNLSLWQYYLLLLLYMVVFMLDDLIIFIIAMTSLKLVGVENKYARFSHLFGGVIVLILGLLMLFKPEWLMFG